MTGPMGCGRMRTSPAGTPVTGGPACHLRRQLATVSVLQFVLNLPDRQAAEAVRCRTGFKYALGLEPGDPGFHHSVLTDFRDRLAEDGRCGVPIIHPCWSGSMPVLVEGAAEPVASADVEVRDLLRIGNRFG